jgi:hypothetical protein
MTLDMMTKAELFFLDLPFWIATVIFVAAYALIVSERIHKTVVAIFAAALMLILKILEQNEAFHVEGFGVDWNVIILLMSMMIIINLMRTTGIFEYVAVKSAKMGKGKPFRHRGFGQCHCGRVVRKSRQENIFFKIHGLRHADDAYHRGNIVAIRLAEILRFKAIKHLTEMEVRRC